MSLSKAQSEYQEGTGMDWQPLDIHQLERFQTLAIQQDPLQDDRNQEFIPLCPTKSASSQEDGFRRIHVKNMGADEGVQEQSSNRKQKDDPAGSQPVEANAAALKSSDDIKAIEQKAYADGFSKGEKDGFAAGKKQAEAVAANLQKMIGEIEGLFQRMVEVNEREILSLIFRTAEKVVMGHIQSDSEVVKRSILHAFEIIPEPSEVSIKIHPEDYEFIELIKEDFFEQIKGLKQVEVVADSAVNRGGCVVETRSGNVVVDMGKRLESIRLSMLEANRVKGSMA